ncbi:MAG: ATP-binding protein [Armatimonadetes bacterium]|nr:ATP-binding protein [Armatimonadota bacterium]
MNSPSLHNWQAANQRYLTAALARTRLALERHIGGPEASPEAASARLSFDESARAMPAPAALAKISSIFGLTAFEQDILLLCAGMEMDASFPALCASAQGDPLRAYPTFSLALAALPDAHWSALTPASPLRAWKLIEVSPGGSLVYSPLKIDERILHYLAGVHHLDGRLVGLIEPCGPLDPPVPSHCRIADRIFALWSDASDGSLLPVAQLCGSDPFAGREIAFAASRSLGLNLHILSATDLPTLPHETDTLIRLWDREAALCGSALLIEDFEPDRVDSSRENALLRIMNAAHGAVFLSAPARRPLRQRRATTFDVGKPAPEEQRSLWQAALRGSPGLNGTLDLLTAQFDLSARAIRNATLEGDARETGAEAASLWEACRALSRPPLESLAQRIEPVAVREDLVLPAPALAILREIAVHVRQRTRVYDTWGFARKSNRGLGISALFSGASGTGKTMAAEVLANELGLDLYRIDLSAVVSKYIGETEKNLKRVFDAAEGGGAILLFDEADALFGKRSEVKDSHDRYANIEISYLLQRMESYRGLAILTTNLKSALDPAFLRRIRFLVQFPFPDAAQRAEIWRHIFPCQVPAEELSFDRLARLNVAGGTIRNIALGAAFRAADAGEPVRMVHLLESARTEYAKLEKPLTEAEIGGWL